MKKIFDSVETLRSSIASNKTITLVAGCFDLLHVGHLSLLEYAKEFEDILVVCVLSDKCVRSYKNPERPIISEIHRAMMVSGLECVDRVYIADKSPSDYETLSILKPKSLVYGLDKNPVSCNTLESRISRIKKEFPNITIHLNKRYETSFTSTSAIIEKIRGII